MYESDGDSHVLLSTTKSPVLDGTLRELSDPVANGDNVTVERQ